MVGQSIFRMMKRQFEALRDGDRFWYQRSLGDEERRMVENTTLADIIRRNTTIDSELPNDVFHVESVSGAGTAAEVPSPRPRVRRF